MLAGGGAERKRLERWFTTNTVQLFPTRILMFECDAVVAERVASGICVYSTEIGEIGVTTHAEHRLFSKSYVAM